MGKDRKIGDDLVAVQIGCGHKKFTTAVLALDIKHHINSEDLFLNL